MEIEDTETMSIEEACEMTLAAVREEYARPWFTSMLKGYYMANTDKWYYAYTIEGDTVTVVDACHAHNMHELVL
jgi:hypothetical protein